MKKVTTDESEKNYSSSSKQSYVSSTVNLFNRYVIKNENGSIDASGVITKKCYQEWLDSRKAISKYPRNAFRKALTGHCRGDKGLKPFEPRVEAAILKLLRKKGVWPCFKGTTGNKIGMRGCKIRGYWETRHRKSAPNSNQSKNVALYPQQSDEINIRFPQSVLPKSTLRSKFLRVQEAYLFIIRSNCKVDRRDVDKVMKYYNETLRTI